MNVKRAAAVVMAVSCLCVSPTFPAPAVSAAEDFVLDNGRLKAEFDDRGLVAITDLQSNRRIEFSGDTASITVDGRTVSGAELGPAEIEITPSRMAYRYVRDPVTLEVLYELRPGRGFLSKHLVYSSALRGGYHVDEVRPLTAILSLPVAGELALQDGTWGALCRFAGRGAAADPGWSLFFMLQNPFMNWKREGKTASVSYVPDMDWNPDDGPFVTDRLCIGLQELGGTRFPARAVPEWRFVPDYGKLLSEVPFIDANEAEALTECVRTFLLVRPFRSIRVHIPWCENDYQIDVGTPEGVEEYERIMDRAAELGCQYLLYTPANGGLSRPQDNADAWGWENLLWFGLGQKIRKNEWDPRRDEVPPSLRSMLDTAASKNLRLLAYAYPSLPFLQDPDWTKWAGDKVGGYSGADTGRRGFQDWWVDKLVAFMKATGGAGFSFDHWWISYDGATSKYAQWFGCRRILETLRREAPGVVIDGRQQYQDFGPWTWLAGSYPHPSLTDEQPESFQAFPDLHTDRVSANRQRFAAWKYRVERFCPPEIMPGFITHQSERSDEEGVMRRDRFRPRDWDVLGWRFSLLSSIATAPFNHVVNFIPARDPGEFKALSGEDIAWFRKWLDWTDQNAAFLKNLRPIIGPPVLGRVDGTAAIVEDRGIVFLFNPNPGRAEARFKLDPAIGLLKGRRFVLREVHPVEGKLVGSPKGFWAYGEEVLISMPGREALVLEVVPVEAEVRQPVLFNARGRVTFRSGSLNLIGGEAETGARRRIVVLLPKNERVRAFAVNGVTYPFKQDGDVVTVDIRFAGRAFEKSQRVGTYDPNFTGGTIRARFTVPGWVTDQLEARKKTWPVDLSEDDLRAPWLGPWRLLLHAPIAEQDESMDITMKINGKPVPVMKAYNSVYPRSPERTYLGSYADLTWIRPDTAYEIEVAVPPVAPGRFLGLFFENVETEYTQRILAPPSAKRQERD
jgi:hypothetical protein